MENGEERNHAAESLGARLQEAETDLRQAREAAALAGVLAWRHIQEWRERCTHAEAITRNWRLMAEKAGAEARCHYDTAEKLRRELKAAEATIRELRERLSSVGDGA